MPTFWNVYIFCPVMTYIFLAIFKAEFLPRGHNHSLSYTSSCTFKQSFHHQRQWIIEWGLVICWNVSPGSVRSTEVPSDWHKLRRVNLVQWLVNWWMCKHLQDTHRTNTHREEEPYRLNLPARLRDTQREARRKQKYIFVLRKKNSNAQ